MKKNFPSDENGLNRKQYESIVEYVEKMIFDGCGGRKIRTMYLIETGKMFRRGRVSDLKVRSYYISNKYKDVAPITNMDRIIYNIQKAISNQTNKYPAWMFDENMLRLALNGCAKIV